MTAAEEYRQFKAEVKNALTFTDIMARYGCGVSAARRIVRSVRAACGNGKLPRGKILPAELEYWENTPIKKQMRI